VPFGLLIGRDIRHQLVHSIVARWIMSSGLVLAALAELSSLSLILTPAAFLLPVARFAGMSWIIGTGFKLPQSRAGITRQLAQSA